VRCSLAGEGKLILARNHPHSGDYPSQTVVILRILYEEIQAILTLQHCICMTAQYVLLTHTCKYYILRASLLNASTVPVLVPMSLWPMASQENTNSMHHTLRWRV
jgi:hypothetical protein